MRLNIGCAQYPIPGFINLDMGPVWRLEYGLPFLDNSVEAITISCVLYAVREDDWPKVFREFYRVLEPGGVIRITEGNTEDHDSRHYNIPYESDYGPTVLTGPQMMGHHLEDAGFEVYDVDAVSTVFSDHSLLQDRHGVEPHVFFIEGIK